MTKDVALDTAREILDRTVCECGHVKSRHGTAKPRPCGGDACSCERFRPVRFLVSRRTKHRPWCQVGQLVPDGSYTVSAPEGVQWDAFVEADCTCRPGPLQVSRAEEMTTSGKGNSDDERTDE